MTLATVDDAIREFAWGAGEERAEHAWVLSPYDVWVRNPHYVGPPQPHPEDEPHPDELDAEVDADVEAVDIDFDDIPF